MATSTSWSLWQKMPPRYQLTTRTADEIDTPEYIYYDVESPRTPRSPRSPRSPRQRPMTSPRQHIAGSSPSGEGRTIHPQSSRRFHFPSRKSSYLDHIKTQQRVNSARMKFASDPSSVTRPPNRRACTAPLISPRTSEREKSFKSVNCPKSQCESVTNPTENSINGQRSKTSLSTATSQEDMISSVSPDSGIHMMIEKAPPRKFTIRETEEGTLYIDNGKVVFFRKKRHDVSHFMNSSNRGNSNGGFLANIRRDYLNKPKYLAAAQKSHGRSITCEEQIIQKERLNYNKKVENILNYYSFDDEDKISMEDLSRYASMKPQKLERGQHLNTRVLTPKVKRLYFDESPGGRPPSPCYDITEDPNVYMKVNSKSKLHDRKFYLKTPGFKMLNKSLTGISPSEFDNCKCGLCRIEMQLSLLAQLGIPLPVQLQQFSLPESSDREENAPNETLQTEKHDNKDKQEHYVKIKEEKNNDEAGDSVSKVLGSRLEQTLTITLPEMTNERETTELSTRGSGRDTGRLNYENTDS